jgi:phosphoribosylaminoimidazolecarboxamide formyltransferase/IMP cyclohydrolase
LNGSKKIQRVLLSVTDKTGLVPFAQYLASLGADLVSTGGTARALREAGLQVRDISDLTGFPEMLDGRVKTLHPKVHGGILQIRSNERHRQTAAEHGIEPIDMVVVNLYAFEETARRPDVDFGHLIENIDIGGPSMVRSAAKNFNDVAVVTSPADYPQLMEEMRSNHGALSLDTRWNLAKKAFAATAAYDSAISRTLKHITSQPSAGAVVEMQPADSNTFPDILEISYPKAADLRYGENPHQKAALYQDGSCVGVANAKQLHGKELSYNNLVDLDACWELIQEFEKPAAAIVKHTNPCGAATASSVLEAYKKALETDPVSAFGGIIGINRELDEATAEEIAKLFVEAVAAPSFSEAALTKLKTKKNLRLLQVRDTRPDKIVRQISGGLLLQDADRGHLTASELKLVTERKPTEAQTRSLLFAWQVAKHVKSNAIVYVRDEQTVGIGAGQMSRVDAARFGAMKAILPLAGTVAASDAFFPFPDGLETAVEAGATAIIQPGGSVRDDLVIQKANELSVAMVFTSMRHFRH